MGYAVAFFNEDPAVVRVIMVFVLVNEFIRSVTDSVDLLKGENLALVNRDVGSAHTFHEIDGFIFQGIKPTAGYSAPEIGPLVLPVHNLSGNHLIHSAAESAAEGQRLRGFPFSHGERLPCAVAVINAQDISRTGSGF